jgi:CheY-like chemotaxis protein/tetratricopeptide (TPR) repeat protein
MSAMLLCVQEDREVGRVYAEALTAEGYEVLSAQDGRGALEILRRQTPMLVLLDVYLPRQDGFEILAEIRMKVDASQLPVLLLCEGDITENVSLRAESLGALGVESSPLAANHLVARVAQLLGRSVKKPDEPVSTSRKGNVRNVPIPELLRTIHVERLDGVLLLDHGRKKKAIELRGGWPVSIKSNLVSECFGNYLVRQGRCTQIQLDESIQRMKTGEGLQGEILVAMDVLEEEQVVSGLREHALEKFFEIFSWGDGRFEIRPGARVQRGASFGIDGHPSKLIVEGVRRHYSLNRIDRYLEFHQSDFLVPLSYESDQLAELGLREEEAHWLCALDGSDTVGSFLQFPDAIRRIAFGLVSVEVLGVAPRPGERSVAVPTIQDGLVGRRDRTLDGAKGDEDLRVELAELANRIRNEDHYKVLGVSSTTSDEDIRVAFDALARNSQPDRFDGASSSVRQLASEVFNRVTEAHAAIATAADRKSYAGELAQGRRARAAEAEGRRALEAETEYQRGEKLVAGRDYEGALLCFGRAIENFPSEGEYHSNYGWCLYLCHPDNEVTLGEALEHCRRGVKLAKDREKPYLLLGRLYKAMGRVGAATKMFTRAVQIRPQCVEAMRELRIINMRRDKDKGVLKRIFRR